MMATAANWFASVVMLVALLGPVLVLHSPARRRLAAFAPSVVLFVLSFPVAATSWGSKAVFPGEGLDDGSIGSGYVVGAAFTVILGLLGLVLAAIVRAIIRRRRRSALRRVPAA
jgi:hypothetical protein